MPKTRVASSTRGAKAAAMRVKFKIGGRKSTTGASTMNQETLADAISKCRPRDKAKLQRLQKSRGW